jgi:hypothetical protein
VKNLLVGPVTAIAASSVKLAMVLLAMSFVRCSSVGTSRSIVGGREVNPESVD